MNKPTTRRGRLRDDQRSVSEVLGYIIIFGLVITAVGFVTLLGMPALEGVQDAEQASNAERAFDVASENMAAIYERDAPSRATEIDLGGSEIYYGDPIVMNVTIDGESNVTEIRPIELRVGDRATLVYEGGAVFRQEGEGGVMLREPPLLLSSDRVHVPVIKTTAPAVEAAGGTTILLRGKSTDRAVLASETEDVDEVTITIESPRYEQWYWYLDDKSAVDCDDPDHDDEQVECSIDDPDTAVVTLQEIEVSLIL